LGELSAAAYFGKGIEAATARAGRGAVYWYVSLSGDDLPPDERDPRTIIEPVTSPMDERFRAIAQATKGDDIRLDELFDRDPIADWGRDSATLLGDAAHPMLPYTGQGAAQALEDAVALGLALASETNPVAGLRKYERVRFARAAPIVKMGRRIARVTTTKNPLIGAARTLAARFLPEGALLAAFYLGGDHDPHREIRSTTAQILTSS
jgi:2-polyprenyl-6-methoxyphenol hydroxylase-like FAD-dependent oxidoreductase